MNTRTAITISATLAASLVSGASHAALQGRDLNGSAGSFEAYYDTVLNITWLANAGALISNWATANTWAANLSFYDAVNNITYDNWRLPTVNPVNGANFNYNGSYNGSTDASYNITSPNSELAYMFYVNLGNPGYYTAAGAFSGCYVSYPSDTCLDNVGPFNNLQPFTYWSATEYAPNTNFAWTLGMASGQQASIIKTSPGYAWAVSPGDVAAVPEAQTYTLMLAGLGLIGWRALRRRHAET